MAGADDVDTLLKERPDLEAPLEDVLAVDQDQETWTFEDVPVDSGHFGELVSRGVVESAGEEYRLADAAAVRAALARDHEGEPESSSDDRSEDRTLPSPTLPSPSFSRPSVSLSSLPAVAPWKLLLPVLILLVGLLRTIPVRGVYRDDAVVLTGNDPYFYRYLVERGVAEGGLPVSEGSGEPLLVATLSALVELLGGTAEVAGNVLAWYPVAAGMAGAVLCYLLAVAVTDDRRVGLAAVFVFALLPHHALRTSVGFADHHAFDYLWLVITALTATKLARVDGEELREPRTIAFTLLVGVAVAGQVLAWEAAPLLLVPLALVVSARAAVDVHRGISPLPVGLPLVAGLGLGAAIALAVHLAAGMQSTVPVLTPGVLAAWAGATLAIAAGAHRVGWSLQRVLAGYGLLGVAGLVGLLVGPATIRTEVARRLVELFRSDGIAETQSLLDPGTAGFFVHIGVVALALPALVVGLRRATNDGRWLVVGTYAWAFLALAVLQVRFVGELAPFLAVFAGVGAVRIAERYNAVPVGATDANGTSHRVPSRPRVAAVVVLIVLSGGVAAGEVADVTGAVVVEDRVYDSATYIAERADERGLEYPENYVLSDWSDNRVHNYYVSGESRSYLYAQGNYTEFAGGTDPDVWFDTFDGRVGFVVLAGAADGVDPRSTIWRLTRNFGSATDDVPGVGHYRPLYIPPDGGRLVVEVVPGATVSGPADPGTAVTVSTTIDRPTVQFNYQRQTVSAEDGTWQVRVANPGTYEVTVGNESTTVEIPEHAILDGQSVAVD